MRREVPCRPTRSPTRDPARRGWRNRKVRNKAVLHSRLSGRGRRQCGWLPRHIRMGVQGCGGCFFPISPSRRYSQGLASLGSDDAVLFRTLATLRVDVPVFKSIDDLWWKGPAKDFKRTSERLKAPNLLKRALARKARLST